MRVEGYKFDNVTQNDLFNTFNKMLLFQKQVENSIKI